MAIQSQGIGSNLDINSIVTQLMAVERRPLSLLASEAQGYRGRISAWGTLKSALASFQTAMKQLDGSAKFRAYQTSVSDATLVSASAGGQASPGTHSVEVGALAQQHKLRSAAFAGLLDPVGTGTLSIQYGSYDSGANTFTLNPARAAQSVAIGAGQNTLSGVRDAINQAGVGVSASIVNDGAGNRLVLTSTDSGAANSLKITVSDDDGGHADLAGLSQLAYDPTQGAGTGRNLTQSVAAQNASAVIDGITVSKASNVISDAVAGTTLTLLKAAPGAPTTLSVSRDGARTEEAVESFVKAYNDVAKSISDITRYDAASKQGGTLQGNAAVLAIQSRLRATLSAAVSTGGAYTALSQIGVAFQKDGTLALDAAKLRSAVEAHFEDIAALFASTGKASDSRVSYLGASANTQPGAYAVAVTQVATRGALAASQAAGLMITAGVDDQLAFYVNGTAASVTLGAGTYASATALAAELQTRLNGSAGLVQAGITVQVTQSAGVLSVTSDRYGSASAVSAPTGNGAAGLFGAAPVATAGVDAAGTINGAAATASGQSLTGAAGDASEGLRLTAAVPAPAAYGTLRFSRGYAAQLAALMDGYLAAGGGISGRLEGLNSSLKSNASRQDAFNARMVDVEARMRAQFTALDRMISRMNSTSTYLQQQLSNLPKPYAQDQRS
ncbi:MAG: flagellar filament capping protein FliD [Burkholderiales bacterium]